MSKKFIIRWAIPFSILLSILFITTANGFALPDYADAKGDFKIFRIRDNKDTVQKKIAYLVENGEITGVKGVESFLCDALGEKVVCSFRYHNSLIGKERVRQIVVDFYKHQSVLTKFDIEEKEFAKYLQSILEKVYGRPLYVRPYFFPAQLEDGQEKYLCKWYLLVKIVGIAVARERDLFTIRIIISDPLLIEELKKDEIQEFN